jgi:hypothetical protein
MQEDTLLLCTRTDERLKIFLLDNTLSNKEKSQIAVHAVLALSWTSEKPERIMEIEI